MKKKTYNILLGAALIASTTYVIFQARADQTYTGEGGLALNPTATGLAPGSVSVQGSHMELGTEKGGVGPGATPTPTPTPTPTQPPTQFAAALLPQQNPLRRYHFSISGLHVGGRVADHWELSGGVSRLRVSGNGEFDNLTKTGVALGIKYLINPDAAPEKTRFAVGAGYDRALLKNIRAYAVASHPFRVKDDRAPILAHLGVRWDRFDLDDVDGPSSSKVSAFTGVELPITRKGEFALTGELQSKNHEFGDAKVPYSLGLRYSPPSNPFNVSVGIQRQGLVDDNGWYAHIGYQFR
jgi:hypothetical protein